MSTSMSNVEDVYNRSRRTIDQGVVIATPCVFTERRNLHGKPYRSRQTVGYEMYEEDEEEEDETHVKSTSISRPTVITALPPMQSVAAGAPAAGTTPGSGAAVPQTPASTPAAAAAVKSLQASAPVYTPPAVNAPVPPTITPPVAQVASTITPSPTNPKKGFVVGNSDPTGSAKVAALNASWYYTWGPKPSAPAPPGNLPFVPMFWNIAKTVNPPTVLAGLVNAPILLAYNEPDGTNASAQGNMTVGSAVSFWPNLVATKATRLGAPVMYGSMVHPPTTPNTLNVPAPTGVTGPVSINISNTGKPNIVHLDPGIWIDNFLIQISQQPNTRFPDFMTIHWYGPPSATSFLSYIDAVWAKYNLPIWVTEYSCADWSATCCPAQHVAGFDWSLPTTSNMSTNATAQFMKATTSGMNSRQYVERYTWKERFLLAAPGGVAASPNYPIPAGVTPDSIMSPTNTDPMNQSALFQSYQHFPTALPPLTPLGQLYSTL